MQQQLPNSNERRQRIGHILREFHPVRLLRSLFTGIIIGCLVIIIEISYAALIFSGDLAVYMPRGVGLTLFGACLLGLMLALKSSFHCVIAIPHSSAAVMLTLLTTAIVKNMSATADLKETFFTIVAAIVLTSLCAGMMFFAVGWFRLSHLIRFIPHPIIGGVLAGIGWLLVKGALYVMTDVSSGTSLSLSLFKVEELVKWLPGLIFAMVLIVVLRRFKHFLIMPVMVLIAIGVFYLLLWATQISFSEIRAQGWLLGTLPERAFWNPFILLSTPVQARWSFIFQQIGNIGTMLMISLISALINVSKLELVAQQDIDANRELQKLGAANVLAGLGGSPIGFHSLNLTTFVYEMGGHSRLAGVFSAGLCGIAALWGASLLSFLPRPVFGGLLLYWGLNFLVEWIYDAWFILSRIDYVLVLVILFFIGAFGFLAGVFAGILFTLGLFVVSYSRINVVKNVLSGVTYQSNVDRLLSQQKLLQQTGEQIFILKLQGFIFFGTADNLLIQVRQRADNPKLLPLRFVVLDFRLVRGIDSSALDSFSKMRQFTRSQNIVLVLTHLSPAMQHHLKQKKTVAEDERFYRIFPDLDHAVEWCENQVLIAENVPLTEEIRLLAEQLRAVFPEPAYVEKLMNYFERKEIIAGYYLMRQGEPPTGLYIIESGQMTVQLEPADGKVVRLRTMGAGSIVGELGLYLGHRASASVLTTQRSSIYRLSTEALRQMEETDPEIAAVFHKFIVCLLGERLTNTNKTLQALSD